MDGLCHNIIRPLDSTKLNKETKKSLCTIFRRVGNVWNLSDKIIWCNGNKNTPDVQVGFVHMSGARVLSSTFKYAHKSITSSTSTFYFLAALLFSLASPVFHIEWEHTELGREKSENGSILLPEHSRSPLRLLLLNLRPPKLSHVYITVQSSHPIDRGAQPSTHTQQPQIRTNIYITSTCRIYTHSRIYIDFFFSAQQPGL